MKRVCAWCNKILDYGEDSDVITHGMCDVCYEKMMKELNEGSKENE